MKESLMQLTHNEVEQKQQQHLTWGSAHLLFCTNGKKKDSTKFPCVALNWFNKLKLIRGHARVSSLYLVFYVVFSFFFFAAEVCACVWWIPCIIRFICHRLASWYFDLVTHWHVSRPPTKPAQFSKVREAQPAARICLLASAIYLLILSLLLFFLLPVPLPVPSPYLLCTGIDSGQHCVYVMCTFGIFGIRNVVPSIFCWHRREPENGSIGRSNTSAASGEPHRIKSVVRSFGGVISRGDSLYSLAIPICKMFLPRWTKVSGKVVLLLDVWFISFNFFNKLASVSVFIGAGTFGNIIWKFCPKNQWLYCVLYWF